MRWIAAPHGRGDDFTLASLSGRTGSGGRGGLRWEELAEEGQSHADPIDWRHRVALTETGVQQRLPERPYGDKVGVVW